MRSLTRQLSIPVIAIVSASLVLGGCTSSSTGSGRPATGSSTPSQSTPVTTTPPPGPASSTVATPSGTTAATSTDGIPGTLGAIFARAEPADLSLYVGDLPTARFDSPSGNIECTIVDQDSANEATCTIATYDFMQPGPECPHGAAVGLGAGDDAHYDGCATTSFNPKSDTALPYDKSLQSGAIACVSASTGVTCLDLKTGAGFTLSKQAMQLFPRQSSEPMTCPSQATLTQAWNLKHPTDHATAVRGTDCIGTWSVAAISAGGITYTGLFRLISGSWQAVDRAVPCEQHTVPAAIFQEACESN